MSSSEQSPRKKNLVTNSWQYCALQDFWDIPVIQKPLLTCMRLTSDVIIHTFRMPVTETATTVSSGEKTKNKLVSTRMSSFCYTLCVSEYKYWQYSNTEVYQNNLKMFASKSDVYFIKWHARNTCTQISNHWIYASLTIGEASTLNEYRAENT